MHLHFNYFLAEVNILIITKFRVTREATSAAGRTRAMRSMKRGVDLLEIISASQMSGEV